MKIEHKKFKPEFINIENIKILIPPITPELPGFREIFAALANPAPKAPDFTVNFDVVTKEDIEFFHALSSGKTDININQLTTNESTGVSYKTINVSKGLFNLIDYSFKAQKPVRFDFKGDSSVILKVNKEGKLSAEFISNDIVMEYALKTSIPVLRQKLDAQGLPYEQIYYRENKKQHNKKKKNKGDER